MNYTNFRSWISQFEEGSQDLEYNAEARRIIDTVIRHIESTPSWFDCQTTTYGFPSEERYGNSDYANLRKIRRAAILKLNELLPEYSDIIFALVPVVGKTPEGSIHNVYWKNSKRIIVIEVPNRSYQSYIYQCKNRVVVGAPLAKAIRKNYDTAIHEIIHFLDIRRTKGKIEKRYVKPDQDYDKYINHPMEFNGWFQAFLAVHINDTFQQALDSLKKEQWFGILNDTLKRHAIKRLFLALTKIPDSPETSR